MLAQEADTLTQLGRGSIRPDRPGWRDRVVNYMHMHMHLSPWRAESEIESTRVPKGHSVRPVHTNYTRTKETMFVV